MSTQANTHLNRTNTHLNQRRLWLPEMEGIMARWYARQRGTPSQIEAWRKQAAQLTVGLPPGAAVLEVAPGPGYLAIETARLGRFHVTGLDISRTFVEIASEKARQAAVGVDSRHGDAAAMPFEPEAFDLIICQAAFKNFRRPVSALDEMHRVLRSGGVAVIHDMRFATGGWLRPVGQHRIDRTIDPALRILGLLGQLAVFAADWLAFLRPSHRAGRGSRWSRLYLSGRWACWLAPGAATLNPDAAQTIAPTTVDTGGFPAPYSNRRTSPPASMWYFS